MITSAIDHPATEAAASPAAYAGGESPSPSSRPYMTCFREDEPAGLLKFNSAFMKFLLSRLATIFFLNHPEICPGDYSRFSGKVILYV